MEPTSNQSKRKSKEDSIKGRANWFFWVVGLTIADLSLVRWGVGINFKGIFAFANFFHSISLNSTGYIQYLALLSLIGLFSMFIILGYFARQEKKWAFMIGVVVYLADAILFLYHQEYIAVCIHIFIVFCFYDGFASITEVDQMKENEKLKKYLNEKISNELK